MKNIKKIVLFMLIAVGFQQITCTQSDNRTQHAEQSERIHQFMHKCYLDGTSDQTRTYLNKIMDGEDFDAIARADAIISNTQLTFEEIRDELSKQGFSSFIWQAGPTVIAMVLFGAVILYWPKK